MKRILISIILIISSIWHSYSQCPDLNKIFKTYISSRDGDYMDVVFYINKAILAMEDLDAIIDFGDGTDIEVWSGENPLTHRYALNSLSSFAGEFYIDVSMDLTGYTWEEDYHVCPLDGMYELIETVTFGDISMGTFFVEAYAEKPSYTVNETINFFYNVEAFGTDVNGLTYELVNLTESGGETGLFYPTNLGQDVQLTYTFTPTHAFSYQFAFKVFQYGMLLEEKIFQVAVNTDGATGGTIDDLCDCDYAFDPIIQLNSTVSDNEMSLSLSNNSSSDFDRYWDEYTINGYLSTLTNGEWTTYHKISAGYGVISNPPDFPNKLNKGNVIFDLPIPLAQKCYFSYNIDFPCKEVVEGDNTIDQYHRLYLNTEVPIGDLSTVTNHYDIPKEGGVTLIDTYTNDCAAIEVYNPNDKTDDLGWIDEIVINDGSIRIKTSKIIEEEGRSLVIRLYVNGYYSPMVNHTQKSSENLSYREISLFQPGLISDPYENDNTVICLPGFDGFDNEQYQYYDWRLRFDSNLGYYSDPNCLPLGENPNRMKDYELVIYGVDEDGNYIVLQTYYVDSYSCSSNTTLDVESRGESIAISRYSDYVDLTGDIEIGETQIIFAGNKISLKPGFKAKEGSAFIASIKGCTPRKSATIDTINSNIFNDSTFVENLNFSIYPNPGSGVFKLDFLGCLPDITDISVLDVNGNLLKVIEISDQLYYEIDISNFPQGAYIIRIVSNNSFHFAKIIKL